MKKTGLLGSTSVYALSSIATSAIPLLLLPILTRLLTPTDYGIVAMFSIWTSITAVFVGLSVQGAIAVKYFELEQNDLQQYVSSCIAILLTSCLFILACVFAFRSLLEKYTSLPTDWLIIGVIVSGMQFVVSVRLTLWQVAKQSVKYGVLQVIQSAINASLSLWLVVILGFAWEGRLLGISAATLLIMLISLGSLWKDGWLMLTVKLSYMQNALKFGVPLIPHSLGAMLLTAIDRVMVTNIIGIDSAGVYTVALQIGMMLNLLTVSVNQAYAPWLYGQLKNSDQMRKCQIVRYTYLYFISVALIALLIGLCAPLILSVMVGDQFRAGAETIAYIAMGFAFGGMYFMVTNYVFFAGMTGKLALNTLSAGLINVVLTYVWVQKNGIAGAGQAFMISQAFLFLGTWRLACRAHPMPWGKCFFKKRENERNN